MRKNKDQKGMTIRKIAAYSAIFLNKNFIIKIILQSVPIIWGIVFLIFKSSFVSSNGNLAGVGIILGIMSAGCSITVSIITGYKSYRDDKKFKKLHIKCESLENEIELRSKVSSARCSINEHDNRMLRDYRDKRFFAPNEVVIFIKESRNPKESICNILEKIKNCISEKTNIPLENIYITAALFIGDATSKGDTEREIKMWNWLSRPCLSGTYDLPELLKKPSCLRAVVHGTPYVAVNSKREAYRDGQYIFDGQDVSTGNEGSIICWEVSEKTQKQNIRLVISIATYGRKMNDINPENLDENITNAYNEFKKNGESEVDYVNRIIKEFYEDIRINILHQFEEDIKENLLLYSTLTNAH